jgi:beta-1,2-mannobiose phosphorylase / 1,2-beta-oligomannan phosphorylase
MATLKKNKRKKIPAKHKLKAKPKKKIATKRLVRSASNPIIKPSSYPNWESQATFNPSAIYHDGKVHIVYRAIGAGDVSTFGYAESDNGLSISKRFSMPIYSNCPNSNKDQSAKIISYVSGGGWNGGCEDPRLTLLGDRVYMLYTAFDGWGSVRIALSSISLDDFISHRFNWKMPVLISPPGEINKNWVLFPQKIEGKYAILHSISPKIMIAYFDSLNELNGNTYIKSINQSDPRWQLRERGIRGAGPSPIKTKYGWLVLYHAMEDNDEGRYKLWAMILDIKDPTKVLYRSPEPVLSPDLWYENEGFKSGVVYSCGAVVKNGELFVYYGGADMVACVATANLDKFLKDLVSNGASKLTPKRK